MNSDQLLDHAMRQLDAPERRRADLELASDPAAAERAARLRHALDTLLDDGLDPVPPPDLALRTIAFVSAQRERKRTIYDFVPATVPFRWADVAVAAGVLLAGLVTLLPAVSRSRDRMAQAGCAYNLQQLGKALMMYGNRHQHFPFAAEKAPGAHAGSYLVILNDDQLLEDLASLDCPSRGQCPKHSPVPRFRELLDLQTSDPDRYRQALHTDYAYNIGFRRGTGPVVPIDLRLSAVPLLADQPDHEQYLRILPGNSPNHGGRGQNVLYSDLHVGFHPTRWIGPRRDDLYLNDDGQLGPGLHERDAVLCPSLVPCGGIPAGTQN